MPPRALTRLAVALLLCCAPLACSKEEPADDRLAAAVAPPTGAKQRLAQARQLIKEGYAHKRDGRNGAALGRFVEAAQIIEGAAGPQSIELASCLDDQASVHLRLGHADKAKALFERASAIAERQPDADPQLAIGLTKRLELVRQLAARGITCTEPETPPSNSPLPYFPVVVEMQEALGRLTPQLADCHDGAPKLVTMRVVITGDGLPVLAEARGPDAGSPLGACLADRLMQLVPGAELPRFRACFRGFIYPFYVGAG